MINVTGRQIPSTSPIPLHMTVSGYNGGLATSATIADDPPTVTSLPSWTERPMSTRSGCRSSTGNVPGQLMLTMPGQQILLDNRSPVPSFRASIQYYQPGGRFSLDQNGNARYSNTFVAFYRDGTDSSTGHMGLNDGASFVRDIPGDLRFDQATLNKLSAGAWVDPEQRKKAIEGVDGQFPVNIEGLSKPKSSYPSKARGAKSGISRSSQLEIQ